MKKFLLAASVLSIGLVASTASAQVNVIATTTGCFYTSPDAACSVGLGSTNLMGLLTYTGGSFNVTVGPGANHNFVGDINDNIGHLALSGNPETLANSFLRVFVTFSSPTLGSPNHTITADLNFNTNGDRLFVQFSETYTNFQYGASNLQMFRFRGAEGSPTEMIAGESEYLGFRVDCVLNGTAACLAPSTSVVPEPSTYAMLTAGLIGIFGVARRRKKNA